MISFTRPSGFLSIAIAWLLFGALGSAQTISRLSTCFLARGEKALLEISVIGKEPQGSPLIPRVEKVGIQAASIGAQQRPITGRRVEYVFEYIVTSYEIGKYVIPPFEVIVEGETTRTEPLEFMVFNPDELQWSEVDVEGTVLRYASSFRTMNLTPYEGETAYTEIKIFVPRELYVEDWGIPDFQRDGLAAWRFQPSAMRSQINLLGRPYVSVAYPSTITPTRSGKIGIGPAKVRLTTIQRVEDPFPKNEYKEVYLEVPRLDFETKTLPEGAPEGFENAVGDFRLSATTSTTDVKEGEPISVQLMVSGSGNLDTLRPPKPINTDGWKIYEPTPELRGDERRQLSGSSIFNQFMRPLEIKAMIPPFRLVYFDPKDETYKTSTTEAIALNMLPETGSKSGSEGPPQALPMPIERMSDILALMNPAQLTLPASPGIPAWAGHLLASLAALGLVAKALWMRFSHHWKKDPAREERLRALQEIEMISPDDNVAFLKSAGSFIESRLGGNPDPELAAILAERDSVCFLAEKPHPAPDRNRRNAILRVLRKAAMACLLISLLGFGTAPARGADTAARAIEAYDSAKYDDAIGLWLGAGAYDDLSADTLYNIGNACYRSGSPGYAALYYRRALIRDTTHQESRQNLRFIERKYGAITVQRPEFQYTIAKLPLSAWKGMLWAGVWLSALALLVFPATRSGARVRMLAVAVLVLSPLLAAVGILGWRYFPNDAEFSPIARQAVITSENTVLHADAARTSPEVIDAPPGSLCEIIQESGRWAYVAFATKTRGWVPLESIEKVLPKEIPTAPKFRKPKADGKSA